MTRAVFERMIENYIQYYCYGDNRIKTRQLLLVRRTSAGQCFPELCFMLGGELKENLEYAIKEMVMSLRSGKGAAIERFKLFVAWLNERISPKLVIGWPPVNPDRRFERMMWLMKALQECPTYDSQEELTNALSEQLWVSTHTIYDDLNVMMMDDGKDETVMGQSTQVDGIERGNGQILFRSSVHPLLLLENLTCVVVLLEALLEKARYKGTHDWAMLTANHVWFQLSEYAQRRVFEVISAKASKGSLLRVHIEELMRAEPINRFVKEEQTATNLQGEVLYLIKTQTHVDIAYRENDGIASHYRGVFKPSHDDECFFFETEKGERLKLYYDRVVEWTTQLI